MSRSTFVTILLSIFLISLPSRATADEKQYIIHTVERGQGVYSIARIYGVTEADIYAANPGSEKVIRIGQELRIPVSSSKNPNTGNAGNHLVKAGETLYSLARQAGITVEDIFKANPSLESEGLIAGRTIVIPSVSNTVTTPDNGTVNPTSNNTAVTSGNETVAPVSDNATAIASNEAVAKTEAVQTVTADDNERIMTTHVVAKRETIYKICRQYGITQTEFLVANPQFYSSKLQIGNVVKIPYPSSKNETVSQVKPDKRKKKDLEGIFKSKIPSAVKDGAESLGNELESIGAVIGEKAGEVGDFIGDVSGKFAEKAVEEYNVIAEAFTPPDRTIDVALMMPFMLDGVQDQNQRKMVEFYQGVLLAVGEMKKAGTDINLRVYDTGGEYASIESILSKEEMENTDLIIGPKFDSHIADAVRFAESRNIPIVLPIHSSNATRYFNDCVYQLNTPQQYMLDNVVSNLTMQFRRPRLIFIDSEGESEAPVIGKMKEELERTHNPYVTFNMDFSDDSLFVHLANTLSPDMQNIFMLTSNSSAALSSALPVLQLAVREKGPSIETHLFGYPEYQAYAYDHMDEFVELDTWFYSWFYLNSREFDTMRFDSEFRQSFRRQLMQSFPNYAAYGYDTARYFLTGISKYGDRLAENLHRIYSRPVQMGFRFIKDENGSYVNHNTFFVHISDSYTIEKVELF